MKTYKISGREFPIVGHVDDDIFGTVPLVDVTMMSDYKWQILSLEGRLKAPEKYRTILGEDVEETIAQLRGYLEGVAV